MQDTLLFIILPVSLLLVCLLLALRLRRVGKGRHRQQQGEGRAAAPVDVSIVVASDERQALLRSLLPRLLSLRYEGEYEVIVVDMMHDKDLEEWLEEMEVHHPNLCHTFCPASARGIDARRLALTLAAKAANYDWLVILPVDAVLNGADWLRMLTGRACGEDGIAIGVSDRRFGWNKLASYIYARRLSLFRPASSVILSRRSILLQGSDVKMSGRQIVKLPDCQFVKP